MILLSDVVAQVESAGNLLAMRFEPDYVPSMVGIQNCQNYVVNGYIDYKTARNICQTSYGKYQIMGDNLFNELNYKNTLFNYLSSEENQLLTFSEFIKKIGFENIEFNLIPKNELNNFAIHYNGSVVYANSLENAYGVLKNG